MVWNVADGGFFTLLFLLKDLTLLSQNLVQDWLQGGLDPAVLLFVGAVVVEF
jgi:hypothetical protein